LPWPSLALVAALAAVVRYLLVEPAQIAHLCDSGAGPWWCGVRAVAIATFSHHALGYVALCLGVLATLIRVRAVAHAAALTGMAGLILYEFEYSAVALLLGLLVLVRGAPAAAGQRDGGRKHPA
jgi:hypothetical protein